MIDAEVHFSAYVLERTDWPLDGSDVLIARYDPPPVIVKETLIAWALRMGELCAVNLGTRFHHGDFVLTSSPDTVLKHGIAPDHPDCVTCLAGRDQALAALRDDPHMTLAVGQLYWSPFPPGA